MAWMWWLLAPVAATVIAAALVWLWTRWDRQRDARRDPMAAHQALIAAFAPIGRGEHSQLPPSNLTVLPATSD
ncbi:MAG: hypothetical protein JWN95_553 [Frankiales bacterium]|nr:hypothetical protein [Frankiales bacterium]